MGVKKKIIMTSFSKTTSCFLLLLTFIVTVFFAVICGGITAWWVVTNHDSSTGELNSDFALPFSGSKTYNIEENSAVIDAVAVVNPSVVSITLTRNVRDYFGQVYEEEGGGTGFIITSDGLILTNKHVVNDSSAEYTVITSDGVSYDAKLMALDPMNDLAIVKIDADGLPVLNLGDSDNLKIGQRVIAIGNALNEYQNTVTTGVVSAVDRTILAGDGYGNNEQLENMIQTDAAINPGNSGGPLVDLDGSVVGINTAIDLDATSIGFAIPINQAKSAIESYIENGVISRPRLGIRYLPLTPEFAALNQLDVKYGALIYSEGVGELAVIPGSPADKADLKVNDIIVAIDGKKIDEKHSLAGLLQNYSPGDTIEVEYYRKGEVSKVSILLDEMK